jgi:anaerobic magnesium-protoporphyrin IX monomethyl ester cyclase
MMKLVLTYPNQKWQKDDFATAWKLNPATLCVLAAMVKDIVDVIIVDANFYQMSEDEFKDKLLEIKPDFIGISVLTTEYASTLDITAAAVREVLPECVVIAGGIHATMEYERVIQNKDIDFVVRGEGEYALRELLMHLATDAPFPKEGIVYKDGDKVVAQNQAFIADISKLPWPDYSFIKLEDYLNTEHRKGPLSAPAFPFYRIAMTKGCPFGCTFCQVETIAGKKIRTKDPEDAVNHIIEMKQKYGIKSLVIDDDNLLGVRSFFKRFLELMIEKEADLPFTMGGVAIWLLDDELLDLMAKAKCRSANVAIESGNKRVLKEIIKKPVKLDKVPEMIRKTQEHGIFVLANFIIGLPGEKWDEILETIHYAEHCGADYVKFFVAVPLRNTKLWDIAIELDVFDTDAAQVEWRFSQIKSNEWTTKDISILRAYEWDRINFGTPEKRKRVYELWGESDEEMEAMRKATRDAVNW